MKKLNQNQLNGSIALYRRGIWEPRFKLWGQLHYTIKKSGCTTSTFTSIAWRDGDLCASIMTPYLCYSGDPKNIQYDKLSVTDTGLILRIAIKTYVKKLYHYSIPNVARSIKTRVINIITAPNRIINNRRAKKNMDAFWKGEMEIL